MTDTPAPTAARERFGHVAPELATLTDEVLFGRVWTDPTLSQRDRSLITVTALIAGYRTNELPFHVRRALENGLTPEELIATLTHLAFYSGWPTAMTALSVVRSAIEEAKAGKG